MKQTRSKKYAELPSNEEIRRIFAHFMDQYFRKRSYESAKALFAPEATGIGSAVHEVCLDTETVHRIIKGDMDQIPDPIEVSDETYVVQRLSSETAVVTGRCVLKGNTPDLDFEIPQLRISAVYSLVKGRLLVSHLHFSLPQRDPGNPESYPIRLLSAVLHETEEKFRLVFENAPIGVLQYDRNGVIQACNIKFLQIMNSSYDRIIGLNMLKLPDTKAVEAVQTSLKGRVGYYNGYYNAVTSGKITPLKAVLSPLLNHLAEIIGGIGIYEDISEYKDAQNRLHYQFQFERVVSSISTSFVNATARQIDTAIENALKLTGQFFDADRCYIFLVDTNRETITNTHEWCEEGVDSLKTKYQNFQYKNLQFLKDFANRLVDHLQYKDISSMPAEAEEFKKILIEDKTVSILMLPLVADGKVIGLFGYDCVKNQRSWSLEEISLLKVIGEIFSSALERKKAEHQRILIEAHRQQSEKANSLGRMAEAIAQQFNNQLQVVIGNLELIRMGSINKAGKNIADALKSATRAADLSAMLMTYLGETHGTTIEEKVRQQKAFSESLPRQLEGGLILVIEDEDMVRFITTSMLQHFNFTVVEAKNGEDAIRILDDQQTRIRLVICDLLMPGMDGWQTLTELRKRAPKLPVIFASGFDEAAAMRGEHTDYPQAFLRKPFNSTSLQEAIRVALK